MQNFKNFLRLYINPAGAMSDTIDTGSWVFAAVAVLVIAGAFYAAVNVRLSEEYRIKTLEEFYTPGSFNYEDEAAYAAEYKRAFSEYDAEMKSRPKIPLFGDKFFYLFDIEPSKFYQPLFLISIFYIPAMILLMSMVSDAGSFGLLFRRDYGTLAVCTLTAWAAANLPFAVIGFAMNAISLPVESYLVVWAASGLLFGFFMIFALRTVFGTNYGVAVLAVSLAWLSMSLGLYVFRYVSPLMFSPFLLFYAFIYLGGSIGSEVRGFGNALRQKQNFKRFLHNATVNPKDADAHVQLGLIYLQRRQEAKAVEYFQKALAIDPNEVDANYELGKLARIKNELQTALDHFSVVLGHDDKYSLSEIWREIGAAYLAANMLDEASNALEKFVERRSADPEGLYYFGKVLKAKGDDERAKEMFAAAVDSVKTSPDFRKGKQRQWGRLAQKELSSFLS